MPDPRLERPCWRGRTNVDAITINGIERAEEIGGHEFICTQGSYQRGAGEPLSAGTHDLGGVVDLRWCGHTACILALRKAGFAAWHRTPSQGPWPDHIHAVGIGHPYLAPVAARQVESYRSGRNGLASNGADDGPRISPIPSLQWPPEDDMADYAAQLDRIEKNAKEAAANVVALAQAEAKRAKATKERDRRLAEGIRKAVKAGKLEVLAAIADELDAG